MSSVRGRLIEKQEAVFKKMEDKLKEHQPPEQPFNLNLLAKRYDTYLFSLSDVLVSAPLVWPANHQYLPQDLPQHLLLHRALALPKNEFQVLFK